MTYAVWRRLFYRKKNVTPMPTNSIVLVATSGKVITVKVNSIIKVER